MEPHDEMRRLRAAVERATGTTGAVSGFASHSGRESAWIHLGVGVVDTRLHGDRNAAIAELRAILRADTSGAVADALVVERAKIAALLDAYLTADDMLLAALNRGLVRDEYHPAAVDRTNALDALKRAVRP